MNPRNENNIENITWAPRMTTMQINTNDLQDHQRRHQMERNQIHNNLIDTNIQNREQNHDDFERALGNFIERLQRRIIIDNRQQNDITLYSQQKHPNNIKNNNQ